ncbi:MAG: AAA family ATPase [Candidatus Symbiothrix sp.]|jgi:hypothetical protein|nr:AAA family ATPase [Candidatus Symbiothrix sp.]
MEKQLKKLPTGIQTFDEIIEDGYIYVDKTKYLVDIIENGKIYFFARPRRFGKSLTVTTLDAMFSGKKHLFKGLYAEAWMNRPDYQSYPIIRLSMNEVTTNQGLDVLIASVQDKVLDCAKRLDVTVDTSVSYADTFKNLIVETHNRYRQKVVILIDEYDKPSVDFYDNPEMADKIREVLADFYVRIKANDEFIRSTILIAKY